MKAKLRKTGEVVELRQYYCDGTAKGVNGEYYHQGDISELFEDIDYKRLEYEFNQLGRTEKCEFISQHIELASSKAIAKYVKEYLFDVLKDIGDGARDSRFVESTIVTSTEINSIEKNSCHYSIVANSGTHSIAECEGNRSIAACTGAYSMAIAQNTSVNSITSNTGFRSVSENKGEFSISANIGEYSATTSYGQYSTAINIGECSIAVSTGDYSVAIATSERSFAKVEGKESIAIVCGTRGRANGKVGCWLILTERGEFNGRSYPLKDIKAIKVDGKKIKETKWYRLINGEIIEDGDIEDKIEP